MKRNGVALIMLLVLGTAAGGYCGGDDAPPPSVGVGLAAAGSDPAVWQFVDMMKCSPAWQCRMGWRDWSVVEDAFGWPLFMQYKDGRTAEIAEDFPAYMVMPYSRVAGDVTLVWDGDGEVSVSGDRIALKEDNFPEKKRRVYLFRGEADGKLELSVTRANPEDHVRNIRLWLPGFEGAGVTFHPEWKKCIEPFAYFRFMDWGRVNNSPQKDWKDRPNVRERRQADGVAYEYMIQLCNEMGRDAWICIPHMATDDYVRQLARLLKGKLKPERRVYIEYSNELGNPSRGQARWLWGRAEEQVRARELTDQKGRPLSNRAYAPTLCGQRSAQIWKIMSDELGDPDRIIRTIAQFHPLDKVMGAALDKRNGDGRVDLIALSGHFIGQGLRGGGLLHNLDHWDIDEAMEALEQRHLFDGAAQWQKEMADIRQQWPRIPIGSYEGGQNFTSPYLRGRDGQKLAARVIQVNADPRIRRVYRTALATWRLAGGTGYTASTECGSWGREGCRGQMRYVGQPLTDVVDRKTGEVVERGAHKYAGLLDYLKRCGERVPGAAPSIAATAPPSPVVGKPYEARLNATGAAPPYTWSLLGGRLPTGLKIAADGRIVGTPTKAEQLLCIVDCTDSRGRHAARLLPLFMDPSAGKKMESFDFDNGLPAGWRRLDGEGTPYYPASAAVAADGTPIDSHYTVEVVLTPMKRMGPRQFVGLTLNLSPGAAQEDYLRIGIDGMGRRLTVLARRVNGGGRAWLRRSCALTPDAGERVSDRALDAGEAWTVRATVQPGGSPGTIDLLVSVYDQNGDARLDATGRNDAANGMLVLRGVPTKTALRRGPFGVLADGCAVQTVRWMKHEGK
jgi:putative Ig domain-containing protein